MKENVVGKIERELDDQESVKGLWFIHSGQVEPTPKEDFGNLSRIYITDLTLTQEGVGWGRTCTYRSILMGKTVPKGCQFPSVQTATQAGKVGPGNQRIPSGSCESAVCPESGRRRGMCGPCLLRCIKLIMEMGQIHLHCDTARPT